MACPFGVIRFHEDPFLDPARPIAHKCDNCRERQARGEIPACVEACKAGALVFEDVNVVLAEKTREIARKATLGVREVHAEAMEGMELLRHFRTRTMDL
jgi:carbon-monoxide dehydrogenase iron sulfur subunit